MWWYTRLLMNPSFASRFLVRLAHCAYWFVHQVCGRRYGSLSKIAQVKAQSGTASVSLDDVLLIAKAYEHVANPLVAHPCTRVGTGKDLQIQSLAGLLADRELGIWTLSVDVIELLHQWVLEHRPKQVLEFSSGVSTLVLADAMSRYLPKQDMPAIVSIEQDATCAKQTSQLLQQAGLAQWAVIHHVPIGQTPFDPSPCYDLQTAGLMAQLKAAYDLILIDGPSCSRRATLPIAQQLVTSACPFMLDDALRDDELADLVIWRDMPGMTVEGIGLIGKGLATGVVKPTLV